MSHKSNIVKKPWGYEYLAYENEHVALWFLFIDYNQSTSMHCHPNKTTGLMLVSGEAEVSFLSNKFPLKPVHKLMIRKGLFHSTKAVSKQGACVFEIETPVDKNDLVRFKDSYGREGKPYEDHTFEMPKQSDCVWIEEPGINDFNTYTLGDGVFLQATSITTVEQLKKIAPNTNVVFLRGGILTDYGTNVAGPGDIVVIEALKELLEVFSKVDDKTIIMTVENTNE
mgnify:CR=1 FL=1